MAEPLQIIGFDTANGLTFQGATVSNFFTLDFALTPGGPWTNWGAVTEQPITGAVMQLPSPFFYRIRQTDSSNFPPYAAVDHTHSDLASGIEAIRTASDITLSASGLIPSVYQGAVSSLYLKDMPNIVNAIKQRIGTTALTLADVTNHVRQLGLTVEAYDTSNPVTGTFQGYRFARVTSGPYGTSETDIAWSVLVTTDVAGASEDTGPSYKLFRVSAYLK